MQMLSPTMIILLLNRQLYRDILCKLISIGLHSVYPTVRSQLCGSRQRLHFPFYFYYCCYSCCGVAVAFAVAVVDSVVVIVVVAVAAAADVVAVAVVVVVVRLVVVIVALKLWIVFPRFSYTQFGQRCCSLSVEKFSCPFAARKMRVSRTPLFAVFPL